MCGPVAGSPIASRTAWTCAASDVTVRAGMRTAAAAPSRAARSSRPFCGLVDEPHLATGGAGLTRQLAAGGEAAAGDDEGGERHARADVRGMVARRHDGAWRRP